VNLSRSTSLYQKNAAGECDWETNLETILGNFSSRFLASIRERNKFLARKTRVKKKAEVESLWAQVSQLRTENERLKEAVRLGNPKSTDTILLDCDFHLPQKLLDLLERMIAEEKPRTTAKYSARSFCITNATAPGDPIVYASPDFVELTGYAMHNILGHNCRFLQGPDTDRNEVNHPSLINFGIPI
jgi:Basic region leucine zipper